MMQTSAGYRLDLALRIFEGLSPLSLFETVFVVGKGKRVRLAWNTRMNKWARLRQDSGAAVQAEFDFAALWQRLRLTNGSKLMEPYVWLVGAQRPSSVHEDADQP